ncbi:hypothetical protein [Streptomyces sp. MUM 178J]|uniref:hypothetical protein n=1 Tax=Streptomyces sp. MUM 178J TaxID=2791991 RepID=UPI001F042FD2|nr:hypothetical protein [Streptomyces sp. MUM 178J]WRQ80326.1 hypothetical protein I3F59_013740 [Streptomyces sp. MUM 178J]
MTSKKSTDAETSTPPAATLHAPSEIEAAARSSKSTLAGWTITGFFTLHFSFNEPGGVDHLKPGRPLKDSQKIDIGEQEDAVVAITALSGAYTDGGKTIRQRPLGQFMVRVRFEKPDIVVCEVRLTDDNSDDPINIWVNVLAISFA